MTNEITRTLPVSKWMVYNSYLKVIAKDGSAGIDDQSIEQFHENLSGNLNKIWNRMTSGCYYPSPVRPVFVSKKQSGKRLPGISTISDRIAQVVVKDYLEPTLEKIFHSSSFDYKTGRNAYNAIRQYHNNCIKYAWVLDVNIKGFFYDISHDIMLELLQKHTREQWIILCAERWLKAGVEQEDGSITLGTKGIPQYGAVGPLFANIYLHHCFDKWMDEVNPQNPFERYGDDISIHCSSRGEAVELLELLKVRMWEYELELLPEKAKIVYRKSYKRNERLYYNDFKFLKYSFQAGTAKYKFGRKNSLLVFCAAIYRLVKTSFSAKLRPML